jgi:hypothetical protein
LKSFFATALLIAAISFSPSFAAKAADHRDAPAVDGVGEGDITDVFAFLDPNNPSRVVVAMGVNSLAVPFLTHSYRFSNKYLYQIKFDGDETFEEHLVIQLLFEDSAKGQIAHVRIGIPDPNNVGASNVYLADAPVKLDGPTGMLASSNSDVQVFTGLRDDPFVFDGQYFRITTELDQDVFRDLPNTILGHLRGRPVRSDGTSGIDTFAGFNASYIVVELPVTWVTNNDMVNIWGTVSTPVEETNTYIQFERMGQQLTNTVFIPSAFKDEFNQGIPSTDMARWSKFVPDTLTTADNDGTGNTISGRVDLLNKLGVGAAPNGAPLLLPATFANTDKDLLRKAIMPDVLRLNVKLAPNDLAVGQFGLQNGRRPGDAVFDIAARLLRQLLDINFPASLKVPGSGAPRANALAVTDPRVTAVIQGTDFNRPDAKLGELSDSGNDRPLLTAFPFFATPHPRPGDPGTIGFPDETN